MMRFSVLIIVMISIAPAAAQTAYDAQIWLSESLTSRANKSWDPDIFADPKTAAALGSVNGISVQVDPKLGERTLVIRNKKPFKLHEGEPRESVVPAGHDMNVRKW